jgi:hypothetical protein
MKSKSQPPAARDAKALIQGAEALLQSVRAELGIDEAEHSQGAERSQGAARVGSEGEPSLLQGERIGAQGYQDQNQGNMPHHEPEREPAGGGDDGVETEGQGLDRREDRMPEMRHDGIEELAAVLRLHVDRDTPIACSIDDMNLVMWRMSRPLPDGHRGRFQNTIIFQWHDKLQGETCWIYALQPTFPR